MIRPNLFIRITGHRIMGTVMQSLSVWCVIEWLKGIFAWPVALLAAAIIIRAYRSMDRMKQYNRWAKEWNTLSEPDEPAQRRGEDLRYD